MDTIKEDLETGDAPDQELRLEDVLAQVEQCIAQLENPQISLEDSFRFYEEGIRKLKICNENYDFLISFCFWQIVMQHFFDFFRPLLYFFF